MASSLTTDNLNNENNIFDENYFKEANSVLSSDGE